MMGTLHEDRYTFLIISHSFLLRMNNFSDERCRENQNTFFFSKNLSVYETMWKNVVGPDGPQMTIRRIACWIPKATNTHSQYVIFIADPLQQWLKEPTSMLRYIVIIKPN